MTMQADARLVAEIDATSATSAKAALAEFAQEAMRAEGATDRLGDAQTILASEARAAASGLDDTTRSALDLERCITALRASYDPLQSSIDRVNRELHEADALYKAGAISAGEFARANTVLGARLNDLQDVHARGAKGARLQAHEVTNLGRQFADVGVQAAMGTNALMIAIMQGPQIADIFSTAAARGIGFRAVLGQIGAMAAPLVVPLAAVATVVGTVAAGFGLFHRELSKGYPDDITKGMGLTAEQLERVEHKTVTFGDTFTATFQEIGAMIMNGPVGDGLRWLGDLFSDTLDWITDAAFESTVKFVGFWVGSFETLKDNWRQFPQVFVAVMTSAFNGGLESIERFVNDGIGAINRLIGVVNKIPGVDLGQLEANVRLGRLATRGRIAQEQEANVAAAEERARAGLSAFGDRVGDRALGRARKRALEEAGDPNKTRARTGKSEEERELERLKSQYERVEDDLRTAQEKANQAYIEDRDILDRALAARLLTVEKHVDQMERLRIRWEGETLKKPRELEAVDADYVKDALGGVTDRTYEDELRRLQSVRGELELLNAAAMDAAAGMEQSFGRVGGAIGNLAGAITGFPAQQAAIAEAVHEEQLTQAQAERETAQLRLRTYGDMAGAAKGFFAEQTAAYKALQAVEMGYRAWQFAASIQAMAQNAAETTTSIAGSMAKGTASAAAGAAKIFEWLGPWGFPVVAGMVGLLASMGLRGAGGGGAAYTGPTAASRQQAQGVGSVLGDTSAKSESLERALGIAEGNWNKDLEYSSQMVRSLRAIEDSIGAVAAGVAREFGANGLLSSSGLNLGTSGRPATLGNLGFGNSTNRTLNDAGIQLDSGSLGELIASGVTGSAYQEVLVNTIKKAFGITYSNKTKVQTITSGLDGDLTGQLTDLLGSLRSGVLSAASILGVEGAEATLDALQVNLGKLSFEGLTGEEIEAEIAAIFGKVGDELALSAIPALQEVQDVGEGAFETLVRVARQYQVVNVTLDSIGVTFGAFGVASLQAREHLVDLVGGLDAFTEQAAFFAENFLTEAERVAPIQRAVTTEMNRLGLTSVDTRDEFKAAVLGLDLTTAAGREMYAALMALAPAFAKLIDYIGETTAAFDWTDADARAAEAVDEARATLLQAYEREAGVLRQTKDRFDGFAKSLASFRQQLSSSEDAMLSPTDRYLTAQREFQRIASQARLGDPQALAELQGVSEEYLAASRDYNATSLAYLSDLALVKAAVQAAEDTAVRQADIADQQLEEMKKQVGLLVDIGDKFVELADAMNGVSAALSRQAAIASAQQQAASGRSFGNNSEVNALLAAATGYAGDFGQGGFQNWIVEQTNAVKEVAAAVLRENGQAGRIVGFAEGGVFTNGVVSQPTLFNTAQMGEAGPEAIMPLVRTNDGLAVRSVRDDENTNEIRQLRADLARMNEALADIAKSNRSMESVLQNVTRGGEAMQTETLAA
jgi:hypothetical protein